MASRPLSAREELPYLVVSLIFTLVVTIVPKPTPNQWDYLAVGWSIILAIAGTFYIYWQNGGSKGDHFIQRYFAIGWVVAVRWFAWVMPVGIFYYSVLGDPKIEHATWHESVFFAACETILYWRIGHHIAALRRIERPVNHTTGQSAL